MSPEELQDDYTKLFLDPFDPTQGGARDYDLNEIYTKENVFDPTYGGTLPSTSGGGSSGAGKGVLDRLLKSFNIPGTDQLDLARLLLVALSGAAGYKGAREPSGGGATEVFTPGATRKFVTTQGTYGPIAKLRNAAGGGIMNAYAAGGPVAMEDGGFVMTKKAVDGAGGPQGIQSLLPGARPIRGPGTGTSDSIPAYIQGRNSVTPARVSNGEAYVPKDTVDQAGGAKRLYGLMHALQRRA